VAIWAGSGILRRRVSDSLALEPVLRDRSPFVVFALAVALSSIRGAGPGMLATIVSAAAATFFLPPFGHFLVDRSYWHTALVEIPLFVTVGLFLSWTGGELRRLRLRARHMLTESRQILDSITDGFVALDDGFQIVYANETAAAGADTPIVGMSVWDALPDWRCAQIRSRLEQALGSVTSVQFEYYSSASERWLEFHVHPAERGITIYFTDVTERKRTEGEVHKALDERDQAIRELRGMRGIVPICAACKKIRDENGDWWPVESYICAHSEVQFSHGMCADCASKFWGDAV